MAGVLVAYDGISVQEFGERAETLLRAATHPTLGRRHLPRTYRPMVELLDYLAVNGFADYIASGGGRDFMRPVSMRPVSDELYGVPRERVMGSPPTLAYAGGGTIRHMPVPDYLDDGPEKPIHIWSRIGRRS